LLFKLIISRKQVNLNKLNESTQCQIHESIFHEKYKQSLKSNPLTSMLFIVPDIINNTSLLCSVAFSVILIIFAIKYKKPSFNISLGPALFYLFSFILISALTVLSITYPKFSFGFMVFVTCILTVFTIPINRFTGLVKKQQYFLEKFLILLEKTLILDYFSVIYVKFFCVPPSLFWKRLFLIFCFNFAYILASRIAFINAVFWDHSLSHTYELFLYTVISLGLCVVYIRLIINISMFLVYSTLRIKPSLLSPPILYVFGVDEDSGEPTPPKPDKPSQKAPSNRNFSLININFNREYYRQFFNNANPGGFRYLGYGLAICGTAAACGTLWYTKVQAEQAIIQAKQAIVQAEQAKVQSYHTARKADVAAVDAGLITKDQYYQRHPEDKPPQQKI